MMSRIRWYRWLVPAAVLALSVTGATAQLKQWPDQQPQARPQTRAWPGDNQPAGAAQPAAVTPPAMAAAPPMIGGPGMGSPGMGSPGMGAPPGAQRDNPCITEFSRMRGEVEKAGKVAKATNERKGTREEFCKAMTNLHAAQVKWVKYTELNAKKCAIPPDIITQLKLGQANLAKMRTNVCDGGATAGGPAAPSLSEALGTARLPIPEPDATKKRGGTLDTLTGEAIR